MKKSYLPFVLSSIFALMVGTSGASANSNVNDNLKVAWAELVSAAGNYGQSLWVAGSDKVHSTIDEIEIGIDNAVKNVKQGAQKIKYGIISTYESAEELARQGWQKMGEYYIATSDAIHGFVDEAKDKFTMIVRTQKCVFKYNIKTAVDMFKQIGDIPAEKWSEFTICMDEQDAWAQMVSEYGHVYGQNIKCLALLGAPNTPKVAEAVVEMYNARLRGYKQYCSNGASGTLEPMPFQPLTVNEKGVYDILSADQQATNLVGTATQPANVVAQNVPKAGDPCSVQYSTSARYINVGGGKLSCAATECQAGTYLVRNAQGQSQGWCKSGIDPHAGPVREDFDMSSLQLSVAVLDVKPIDAPDIDVSRLSLTAPATVPAVSEVDAKLAGIDAKAAAQKQEILNEARCKELGAKAVEMAACKKNPDEWGKQKLAKMQAEQTKDANEQKCLDLGLRRATVEFNQCKSDPTTYAANKQVCDGLGLNSVEFGKCMKNPTEYSTQRLAQLQAQQAEAQKKATCDSLGATSGANKNLCMENPDAYKTAKSQCDGMNATGAAFNKCIKDPSGYKVQYDLEMAAKNSGMSVREYEQAQDREAEIKRLQQSLGLIQS